ncbi:MAG: Asp23/Gls24 family envelope stress response protein [Clostridia bacterium]|nr:Asp23/Gls24 family envelope stress response protein [Clostridia bacterium]
MMADKEIIFETQENGKIMIANEVVMSIAAQALEEIKGVVVATSIAEGIVDKIIKKNTARGISIYTDEETGLTDVDVHVNVDYGINVLEISWSVQEAVKKNVTAMTDVKVGNVNVFVDGLTVEKEPKPKKEKEPKKEVKEEK